MWSRLHTALGDVMIGPAVTPFPDPELAVAATGAGKPAAAPAAADHPDEDPVPSHTFRASSVLDVRGLGVSSATTTLAPVDAITLSVSHGESLGLVGTVAAGAISVALAIAGELPEGAAIAAGSILVEGVELVGPGRGPAARLLGTVIGYLPADPLSSFDRTRSVRNQLAGALRKRIGVTPDVAKRHIVDLLDLVGVVDPAARARQYPQDLDPVVLHRVVLAAVLSGDPALVIAVSPGAGLEPDARAAHATLLRDLWHAKEFALLVASTDFEIVAETCDRVAVVEAGRIALQGSVAEIRDARYGVKSARSARSAASIASASSGLASAG
ncbi:ABC transporter ATP-binding protein [Cryobacterium sp. MDB1-18-2]|nr:ABC transporter ATP-binding protein [Cryobacterium sp. MDB1-18-2]TFC41676.1 ABC transporter ATP-binding protein [Cryobacterium sp. MDB1-18-1]